MGPTLIRSTYLLPRSTLSITSRIRCASTPAIRGHARASQQCLLQGAESKARSYSFGTATRVLRFFAFHQSALSDQIGLTVYYSVLVPEISVARHLSVDASQFGGECLRADHSFADRGSLQWDRGKAWMSPTGYEREAHKDKLGDHPPIRARSI